MAVSFTSSFKLFRLAEDFVVFSLVGMPAREVNPSHKKYESNNSVVADAVIKVRTVPS